MVQPAISNVPEHELHGQYGCTLHRLEPNFTMRCNNQGVIQVKMGLWWTYQGVP